jgi:hypothetical protein
MTVPQTRLRRCNKSGRDCARGGRLSAPPGVAAAGVAGPSAGVTAGEGAGCAAAAAGDEGVLGGISARWQRCAWVATGAPVSRTLRPFDRAECDGSASHDRQSRVDQLRRDLLVCMYCRPTAVIIASPY